MTQCHPKILIHVNKTSKLSSELAKKAKKIFFFRSSYRSKDGRNRSLPPLPDDRINNDFEFKDEE